MLTTQNLTETIVFQAFQQLASTAELVNVKNQLAGAQAEIARLQKERDVLREQPAAMVPAPVEEVGDPS